MNKVFSRNPAGDLRECPNQTVVEALTHPSNRHPVNPVVDHTLEGRSGTQYPCAVIFDEVHWIKIIVAAVSNRHFQLNGSLRLVVHRAAHTDECRYCVEQTATAGCERRVQILLNHVRPAWTAPWRLNLGILLALSRL